MSMVIGCIARLPGGFCHLEMGLLQNIVLGGDLAAIDQIGNLCISHNCIASDLAAVHPSESYGFIPLPCHVLKAVIEDVDFCDRILPIFAVDIQRGVAGIVHVEGVVPDCQVLKPGFLRFDHEYLVAA